jgi:peptide/nickel transport system permease protein
MSLGFKNIKNVIRKRGVKWEVRALLLFLIASFLSPVITNNKPIFCTVNGQSYYPALSELFGSTSAVNVDGKLFTSSSDWNTLTYESVLWAPLKNGPMYNDKANKDFQSPLASSVDENDAPLGFREQHLLGTNRQGNDVFSNLLGGIKYSLIIGVCAILIASIIGIFLGAISGFYLDRFEMGKIQAIGIAVAIIPAWFYGFSTRSYSIVDGFEQSPLNGTLQLLFSLAIFFVIIFSLGWCGKKLDKKLKTKPFNLNIDGLITGLTEVFSSVPRIILIVTIAAISGEKSTLVLILILGLTSWPAFARITRAEVMRLKQKPFIDSAVVSGVPDRKIISVHILKNALPTLVVGIAFGIGSVILVESALSFLNIGVPDNTPTLGAILRSGREHIQAWWLIVFPGLAIFLLIYLFNRIGDKIAERSNT